MKANDFPSFIMRKIIRQPVCFKIQWSCCLLPRCFADLRLCLLICRDDFQVPPKHSIFLCHAGAQKAFVEQLYVDLKRRGLSPFFDQCPDSLPKGEVFPERIFKAAKECLVAVVVLSSEFLVSLWPMLELAAFVQAQRTCNPNLKIFPLFYKLEVADLKKDSKAITLRMAKWKEMAAVEERIDIDAWQNSVAALSRANGEVFSSYAGSEVKYREAIVDSICKLVGRDRLCNVSAPVLYLLHLVIELGNRGVKHLCHVNFLFIFLAFCVNGDGKDLAV